MHKFTQKPLQKTLVVALLTLVCGTGLVACGQKGPLYLPQEQNEPQPGGATAPVQKPAPVVAPVPANDPS